MSDLLNHPVLKDKKYLYIFLGVLNFTLFFGYFAFQILPETAPQRKLASVENRLQSLTHSPHISKFSKHLSVLQLELKAETEVPESNSETYEITGSLRLQRDTFGNPLKFHWHLDDGVQLLDGLLEGILENPVIGQDYHLKIKVSGFSKEHSRLVRLEAFIDGEEIKIGNSALIHSRPEDSYEFIAPAVQMAVEQNDQKERISRGLASENDENFKDSNYPEKLRK